MIEHIGCIRPIVVSESLDSIVFLSHIVPVAMVSHTTILSVTH